MYEKVIYEISSKGKKGYMLPPQDVPQYEVPEKYLRKTDNHLPEVSEREVMSHFVNISSKNYHIDKGFYPLGSCTMKYNPKINEAMARLDGLANIHPYQDEKMVQGALRLMYELQGSLGEITGMDAFTLQPAAGAHGEKTGLMLMHQYHRGRNDLKRDKIIVPDSSHGTNPASAAMTGFKIIEVPSNERGGVDIEALKNVVGDDTAGLMLTNPSTLGLFEENITEIAGIIHGAGGLLYYDGANMNAIMGYARPGDMGFDIIHLNLHKTFTTPHGGGGPGAGPVGVKEFLKEFLPVPMIDKKDETYTLRYDMENSIGKVKSFYGNFGMLIRAYTYILTMGSDGLKHVSEMAVLNANYLKENLKEYYQLPYDILCKHEFVLSGKSMKKKYGVSTMDIAKRLIDYGYHPPSVYFPLIVEEAIMIEPTETESKETLDEFIKVMITIAKEAAENPDLLHEAPHHSPVRRLDDSGAARNPILKWQDIE
ncbi:Glycine dehydrogenase (decarboxylating) [Alkaliphilus metalliredigens QYMF]|uniref:Probable glycine dehydrogenase (decarboxylating) subunit 2 n=1 Tax=Alkaliphilus metalliredigens (strain QYMF) TaxID=293826 RepID=A6TJ91_ALKMQ|nr:aminomethyl-transferring glycine dehydrogenase subunit GcvPB [Alkaliphilus metalliredigens]ABR46259.1 Glycine dehydrogenase (decarboxylating) [Alkaliphilus metalliredigens QYMF]